MCDHANVSNSNDLKAARGGGRGHVRGQEARSRPAIQEKTGRKDILSKSGKRMCSLPKDEERTGTLRSLSKEHKI